MGPGPTRPTPRGRREPPPFRRVEVRSVEALSSRMARITLGGKELEGLIVTEPAASMRLLLPSLDTNELVIPTWNGNEFLLPGGRRPSIRTLTPRRVDEARLELDVEIVLHGRGVASRWAEAAEPGAVAAVSGPGRGYTVDDEATGFLLAGDETAIPAISQLLEVLPEATPVQVHIEIAHAGARLALPDHPRTRISWHEPPDDAVPGDAFVAAVRGTELDRRTSVWAAGEAAAVQRVRRDLFETRRLPRSRAVVRGYWKRGRSAEPGDA